MNLTEAILKNLKIEHEITTTEAGSNLWLFKRIDSGLSYMSCLSCLDKDEKTLILHESIRNELISNGDPNMREYGLVIKVFGVNNAYNVRIMRCSFCLKKVDTFFAFGSVPNAQQFTIELIKAYKANQDEDLGFAIATILAFFNTKTFAKKIAEAIYPDVPFILM